jgi:hypothetical protein
MCLLAVITMTDVRTSAVSTGDDPFAFLQPGATFGASDRQDLARGKVVVRVLPAIAAELAVLAASKLDAPPEALITWTRRIEDLKRGPFVSAIRRFSEPPVLHDLDELVLDERDLQAIRRCQSGDCDVKIAAGEIQDLRNVADFAGPAWRDAVQREFRRIVLDRLNTYRAGGLAALPPSADRGKARSPHHVFAEILAHSPYIRAHLPDVADRLQEFPRSSIPGLESLFYWSQEKYGSSRQVVTLTHVDIVRSAYRSVPPVIVIGKEIFASHYRNGSLGMTAVVYGAERDVNYLVYLNRSHVDVLDGLLSGFKRMIIERRIRSESTQIVSVVRQRLEKRDGP